MTPILKCELQCPCSSDDMYMYNHKKIKSRYKGAHYSYVRRYGLLINTIHIQSKSLGLQAFTNIRRNVFYLLLTFRTYLLPVGFSRATRPRAARFHLFRLSNTQNKAPRAPSPHSSQLRCEIN
jgi:hypothetical protein